MKNEKGITLIALVITIIVMLILVTVTIRVATDGDLFTHASNAVKGTKSAIAGENAILNDELDKSIEEIVAEQTGGSSTPAVTLIHFTIDGTEYTAEEEMTWAQWVEDTRYGGDAFSIINGQVRTQLNNSNWGVSNDASGSSADVYPTDLIINNHTYGLATVK